MEKLCKKGTGKALGFEGCLQRKERHKYGLCKDCFSKWISNTESGQRFLKSNVIPNAKQKVKREKQKQKKSDRIKLMSVDEYRKKELQPVINEIIRIIDYGQPCIAQPKQKGTDAGHFISVGSNRTLALHLHNIHLQSRDSNSYKGGDDLAYYKGLIRVYGKEYAEWCDSLRQIKPIKLTKEELIEARKRAMEFKKELRKESISSPKLRIELRNAGNNYLGLYPQKYSNFNI